MKKLLIVLLTLALLIPSASALGLTVGFSQIGQESDWRTANTDDVCAAIEGAGWTLVYDDAQQKQENQVKALRNFITQGVDYIVFTAIVTTGWDEVIAEINEAEIPLVLIDRFPETAFDNDDWYTTYFGGDFPEEGARAARWIVNYFTSIGRGAMRKSASSVWKAPPAPTRRLAAPRALTKKSRKYPNFKIVASQTGNFTGAEGQAVMESLLKSVDTIDVLWAENDNMALGAIEAIKAAGLVPGEDIIIVGCDAIKLAFEAIVNGEMNCTVECTPLMGSRVVEVITGLEAGETFDKVVHPVEYVYDTAGGIAYTDAGDLSMPAADYIDSRLY